MELLDGQTRRHLSRTRDHLQRNVRILENRLQRNVRILITIPFLTGITVSFHHFFFSFHYINEWCVGFFFSNFYIHYTNVSRSFYHPDTFFLLLVQIAADMLSSSSHHKYMKDRNVVL